MNGKDVRMSRLLDDVRHLHYWAASSGTDALTGMAVAIAS
jgi:hypothetical protein